MLRQPTSAYENIPVFLKFSSAQDQLNAADPDVAKAVSLAAKEGWKQALEQVYGRNSGAVEYASNSRRQNFLDLVPMTSSSTVLEIGIGFGQHTVHLARRVCRLDTYELNLLNSLFTRLRCEQEGIANVYHSCGGDDCTLPFDSSCFDAVILNLVLEWCADRNAEAPGISGQVRLLREIHRVLKPGGFIQLNTKNRFALRYILGGRDEHLASMRFGSALPRFVSRILLAIMGANANGYLHSYCALRHIMEECGFEIAKTYEAYPEMRYPDVFVDSAAPHELPKLQKLGPSRRTDYVMRFIPRRLRKYFTPGLFFIARKN